MPTVRRRINEMAMLMVVSSACLAVLIIVAGTILLIANGKLSAELLGGIQGLGVGTGLLGLASIPFFMIREVFKRGSGSGDD